MNKFSLNDVVKYTGRPGLFTVVGIERNQSGYIYKIFLKSQYDNIDLDGGNISFEELIVFHDVAEDQLSHIFS